MALGLLWLVVGGMVLYLFLLRLWSTLPPDPGFRQRLAGWLVLLAVAAALYTLWAIRTSAGRRSDPSLQNPPSWYPTRR